jgi:hypothetical protein
MLKTQLLNKWHMLLLKIQGSKTPLLLLPRIQQSKTRQVAQEELLSDKLSNERIQN